MHSINSLIVAMVTVLQIAGTTRAARTDHSRAGLVTGQQERAEDRLLDSNGIRIRYVDEGDGPPVVLVHGYLGNLERHWVNTGVFAKLVTDHRVIALDCRGHGKSDKPARPDAYGAEMGKDIVRLLDHLHIARAHIVGFSMGAIIAGHLLTTDPDRFLSATLVAYHPVHAWTSADARDAEAEARDLESDAPFRRLILAVSPPDATPTELEILKLSRQLAAANDVNALAAYHRGRAALATTDEALAAVRVPTLGIIGSADPGLADLKETRRVMPALTSVIVIDRATHGESGVLRRPEFVAALREFLTQHDSLVMADFEGDKAEARAGLALWPYADEQFGGTSEARVTLIHPGANGSKGAARVSFRVTDDSPAPFAGAWAMIGPRGLPPICLRTAACASTRVANIRALSRLASCVSRDRSDDTWRLSKFVRSGRASSCRSKNSLKPVRRARRRTRRRSRRGTSRRSA
jgi:pimeloyl-ACP methyl ester carboxylesterase